MRWPPLTVSEARRTVPRVRNATIDWLLESDPAIRWQVLRDLTDASPEDVAAERAKVPHEGWGALLLSKQEPTGDWGPNDEPGDHWQWNMSTLMQLRWFEPDPFDGRVVDAIGRTRDQVTWGEEFANNPFFDGETEPCINGMTLSIGAYFQQAVEKLATRLLGEELGDGGWNCESDYGDSVVSSFDSTLCVIEGLLLYERAGMPQASAAAAARVRGEQYLLERGLFRSKRSGEIVDDGYLEFGLPQRWRYDILRALDHFRRVGDPPDPRVSEALDIVEKGAVEKARDAAERWPLVERKVISHRHLDGALGDDHALRWNALRAMRVLRWAGRL